ncbi:uncharacterized protein LOC116201737 [Punica granatum]|uniref:Uncharacterized protein LOC116201737 n=1 Tax=Punica granatum TaxID=22663 RepID=A0A218WWZ2_PUNGR|nr:uncharacterized protein LOC116201737 [Punica granatum]OWM76552.1 hypothetical protein CDL15_Pgr005516 [Punica granatum]
MEGSRMMKLLMVMVVAMVLVIGANCKDVDDAPENFDIGADVVPNMSKQWCFRFCLATCVDRAILSCVPSCRKACHITMSDLIFEVGRIIADPGQTDLAALPNAAPAPPPMVVRRMLN